MKPPAGLNAIALALRNPNFRIYTAGNVASLIGTWMQRMAAGWLAWELTQSGAWLGLIAFADLFPMVLITPLAGAAADRWDRLKVTRATQTLSLMQAVVLCVLVFTNTIDIWMLFFATLFLGAVTAFDQPARLSLIPALVPRSDLGAAVAVNSIIFNLARFVGAALAGFVIAVSGVGMAFALNGLSFAAFLFALWTIRIAPASPVSGPQTGMITQFVEGLRYTATHAGISAALILLMATALGGRPVVELLPGLAAEVFSFGPSGLALLTAATGAGAVVGGLMMGDATRPQAHMRMLISSTLVLAAGTLVFAASDLVWIGVPALFATGFGSARAGIAAQTLIQLTVDESRRGRVLAIFGVIFRGCPAIGALAMGVMSEHWGLRASVFVGGLVVLAGWAWACFGRNRVSGSG